MNRHKKRKQKKLAVMGAGVFIAALFAGMLVVGLVFFQFSSPGESLEKSGDQAYDQGDYGQALAFWIRAESHIEFHARLYEKIGRVHLKLSNVNQAEKYFRKALEKGSQNPDIQKHLIRIALVNGDFAKADTIIAGLAADGGQDSGICILRGDALLLKRDFEGGKNAYEKAIRLAPDMIRPKLKLAICLLEQGNTFDAERIVTRCRGGEINDPLDMMLLADYYMLSENEAVAELFMLKAMDTDPENLEFKHRLCGFYRASRMNEKAVAYLQDLVQVYPDNTEFKMMLVDLYLSLEDLERADQLLTELAASAREALGYDLLMGKYWLKKGRNSHAVSFLKSALDKNSGLVSAYYLLGVAYFAGGQTKLAENAFINALTLVPDHSNTLAAMAGLQYKNRAYDLAVQYIDRLIEQVVSDPGAWRIKGLCLLEKGDSLAASQAFSKAWYLGGDRSSLFFLGRSFEVRQMTAEAEDVYESVLKESPGMFDALYAYARLKASEGKGNQVLKKINEWIGRGQEHPALHYTGARICLELGDYDQCRFYIDTAMKNKDASGEFYLLLADMLKVRKDDSGVEKTLVNCTREQPRFLEGWLRLSGYYLQRLNVEAAAEVMENALKLFPDHPEVMGNLAWLLLDTGTDFDRALDLARKAYDLMPDQAWLMDTLGWAYYHKKIYSQAEWMLARAGELSPDNSLIQYHQAMVVYRQGRLSAAREKLTAALKGSSLDTLTRETAESFLAGLNGTPMPADEKGTELFDLETESIFELEQKVPEFTEDQEDILQPDWGNMNSRL